MLFGQDREKLRQIYYTTWQKVQQATELDDLESILAAVIKSHPEYHGFLSKQDNLSKDFIHTDHGNPFLHMGLHVALREQIKLNAPEGIVDIYLQLQKNEQDLHKIEHKMIDVLAEIIWQSNKTNFFDESRYLNNLYELISNK